MKGEDEVHLEDVMKKAAIRHVAPSTVSKHFSKYMGIRWRHPREEPLRQMLDMSERVSICRRWAHVPNNYFTDRIDGIMDNKKFEIPRPPRPGAMRKW